MLRSPLAAALVSLVLSTLAACSSCPRCDGVCVDTTEDDDHCGECNRPCPRGYDCENSRCICSAPFVDCGGLCADLRSDPTNCGTCGNACAAGALCASGECVETPDAGPDTPTTPDAGRCDAPRTMCGSDCVDTQTSSLHCGGCSQPCGRGESCEAGVCECARCEGVCTDLDSDDAHCGECGNACEVDASCLEGRCLGDRRLEFVLSWNLPGDMDLRVLRPDGVEIFFGNRVPPEGPDGLDGDLDADDTTMTGPERIGFDSPTAGEYVVCVDPFSISRATEWELLLRERGEVLMTFSGTDMPGDPRNQPCTEATSETVYPFLP